MNTRIILFLIFSSLALASCKKEESDDNTVASPSYGSGVWVSNEGAFGANNASLSFISENNAVTNDVFNQANGQGLGDVAQHILIAGDLGFAALNGSQKVEVFDITSGQRRHVITGLDYPRRFCQGTDGTVFLTNGSLAGTVNALDGASGDILWSLPVGMGPEHMASANDRLVVCNNGGWALDSTVTVINITSQTVEETIHVGHRPSDIAVDGAGDFWVLCSGETLYDEAWNEIGHSMAKLVEIDGSTLEIAQSFDLGEEGDHPTLLALSEVEWPLVNLNGISTIHPTTGSNSPLIEGAFYSLDVHPNTGEIWAAPYPDFASSGAIKVFSGTGELTATYEVGIAPNAVSFRLD